MATPVLRLPLMVSAGEASYWTADMPAVEAHGTEKNSDRSLDRLRPRVHGNHLSRVMSLPKITDSIQSEVILTRL